MKRLNKVTLIHVPHYYFHFVLVLFFHNSVLSTANLQSHYITINTFEEFNHNLTIRGLSWGTNFSELPVSAQVPPDANGWFVYRQKRSNTVPDPKEISVKWFNPIFKSSGNINCTIQYYTTTRLIQLGPQLGLPNSRDKNFTISTPYEKSTKIAKLWVTKDSNAVQIWADHVPFGTIFVIYQIRVDYDVYKITTTTEGPFSTTEVPTTETSSSTTDEETTPSPTIPSPTTEDTTTTEDDVSPTPTEASSSSSTTEEITTENVTSATEEATTEGISSTTEEATTEGISSTTEEATTEGISSTTEEVTTEGISSTTEEATTEGISSTAEDLSSPSSSSTIEDVTTEISSTSTTMETTETSASTGSTTSSTQASDIPFPSSTAQSPSTTLTASSSTTYSSTSFIPTASTTYTTESSSPTTMTDFPSTLSSTSTKTSTTEKGDSTTSAPTVINSTSTTSKPGGEKHTNGLSTKEILLYIVLPAGLLTLCILAAICLLSKRSVQSNYHQRSSFSDKKPFAYIYSNASAVFPGSQQWTSGSNGVNGHYLPNSGLQLDVRSYPSSSSIHQMIQMQPRTNSSFYWGNGRPRHFHGVNTHANQYFPRMEREY